MLNFSERKERDIWHPESGRGEHACGHARLLLKQTVEGEKQETRRGGTPVTNASETHCVRLMLQPDSGDAGYRATLSQSV